MMIVGCTACRTFLTYLGLQNNCIVKQTHPLLGLFIYLSIVNAHLFEWVNAQISVIQEYSIGLISCLSC